MHWFWRGAIAVVLASVVYRLRFLIPLHLITSASFRTYSLVVLVIISATIPSTVALACWAFLTRRFPPTPTPDGETRCRKCGYILRGISEPRCSECGEVI
jgi:uncharacterized paraquat-inducible protein A